MRGRKKKRGPKVLDCDACTARKRAASDYLLGAGVESGAGAGVVEGAGVMSAGGVVAGAGAGSGAAMGAGAGAAIGAGASVLLQADRPNANKEATRRDLFMEFLPIRSGR